MASETRNGSPWMVRHATAILITAALLVIPIVYGAHRLDATHDNRVSIWLPHGHEGTREYDWFVELFGTDQVILVSWDGCTLEDPRLECFAQGVESDRGIEGESELWAASVWTGQRIVKRLRKPPEELTLHQGTQRLQGVLVGPDHKTTGALIVLVLSGNRHCCSTLDRIRSIAAQQCDVPLSDLHLGGDIVSARAIDVEGDQAVGRWLVPSIGLSFLAAWLSLKSWRLSLVVFVLAQYCAFGLEATIYYVGGRMNLLLTLVPVLVYVLALSTSVHISNYYRDALRHHPPHIAPWIALLHGWRPCSISALTTALGLISLLVSHIPAVKSFGKFGALGILLGFALLIVLLPAALAKFPEHGRESTLSGRRKLFDVAMPAFVSRYRNALVLVFLVVTALAGAGVTRIETSVSPMRFLPQNSRCLQDARWFGTHIGPLTPYEILVGVPRDLSTRFGSRMRLVREIQRAMHSLKAVRGSTSAATFAPPLGPVGRISTVERARRAILDRQLAEHHDIFVREGYVAEEGDYQWWRITLRLNRIDQLDLAVFRHDVDQRVGSVLRRLKVDSANMKVVQTGTVPLFYIAQQELLDSLTLSFIAALATITLVMIITMRHFVAGLIVMLPNVFPAALVFGAMGWSSIIVDVGSMMTASVALGIAVDDTLHFLTWYERGLEETGSRVLALRRAFQISAPAMLQTTAIAGLGLAVFALSDFQPVSRFGFLMSSLLVAAVVGDLLFLPAILVSPLGRYFGRRNGAGKASV